MKLTIKVKTFRFYCDQSFANNCGGGRTSNVRSRFKNNNPPEISNDEGVIIRDADEETDIIAVNR